MALTNESHELSPLKDDNSSTDSGVADDRESNESSSDSRESGDSGVSTNTYSSGGSHSSTKPLIKPNRHTDEAPGNGSDISTTPFIKSEGQRDEPPGTGDIEQQPSVDFKRNSEQGAVNADNSFWIKIVVIFSILDVLLIVTILVVALGLPHSDKATPAQSGNCLNCTDVYLTQDDKIDNIYNFIIHGDMCCSENETLLIQKYVIKRYRSDQAKASAERGFPNRTAIHVDLDRDDENSIKEGTDQVLKWRAPTLMYGALSLSQDGTRILVGRTGLYYVSPRVVFDDKKGDIGEAGLDPMTLQLFRERDSGEKQLLLEAKETHCAHSETKCSKPSSGQGVFKMEKGDNVIVKVTKPCGLVLQDKLNHLDMYLI